MLTASTVAQHLELSFLLGLCPVFVYRGVYLWKLNRDVTVVLHCLLLLFQTLFVFFTVPVGVTLSDVLFSFYSSLKWKYVKWMQNDAVLWLEKSLIIVYFPHLDPCVS